MNQDECLQLITKYCDPIFDNWLHKPEALDVDELWDMIRDDLLLEFSADVEDMAAIAAITIITTYKLLFKHRKVVNDDLNNTVTQCLN
jgi:hypothetical protein